MTTRVLPSAEWDRVAHLDVAALLPWVAPADVQLVVAEEGDRVIGCWAVMRMVHVEGLWVDPAYRGNPRVAKRLFAATWQRVRAWTSQWVMTGAVSGQTRELLQHVGAVPLPSEMFIVPVENAMSARMAPQEMPCRP